MKASGFLFSLVLLIGTLHTYGQDSLEVDSFIIVKEFVPTLSQSAKIRINPVISDSQNLEVDMKYSFLSKKLSHQFDPEVIKAATLKGEPLVKLHHNYLILGYGNNATPIAEFYYNQLRSKKSAIGVYGRHLSSTGIKDIENSGFSNNTVGISGSRYSRKFTFSGKLDYRYDAVNYYGYRTDAPGYMTDVTDLNEGIDQYYNRFNVALSFGNNQRDTTGLRHFSEISYRHVSDKFNSSESGFILNQQYNIIHSKEFYTFDWGLDHNKLSDEITGTELDHSNENTILYLEPGIDLRGNKWSLKGAIKLAAEFDSETNLFFYPVLDFKYNLVKSIIIPYAGLDGGLKRNSYGSFTKENPFVLSAVELRNTDENLRIYGGIRGHLSKNTSFNLSFSQSVIKDLPLYVKDTSSFNREGRGFAVVYDDVNVTEIGAELLYEPAEKWQFILNGNYYLYDASVQLHAWHKPDYRISAITSYTIGSKIKTELLLYLIGSQKARTFETSALVNNVQSFESLDGTVDVNLNFEYRYSKKIGVFLDLNNLASINYEKWQDYPTQGFNVLAGFKFSF